MNSLSIWNRTSRILVWIAIMYALWNPFYPWNILGGVITATTGSTEIQDETYRWIAIAAVAVIVIFLVAFLYRRLMLVLDNKYVWVLVMQAFGITVGLGVLTVLAGKLWATGGQFAPADYIVAFSWLWQIPVGYFIGAGLNWAAMTFKISGQRAVTPLDTVDHHNHQ